MYATSSKLGRMSRFVTAMAAAAFLLYGCGGGSDGTAGKDGQTGQQGIQGPAGPTVVAVDATNLTFEDLRNRSLAVAIQSVDTSGDQPVVKVKVTMKDSGEGVRGLGTFTLQIAQLKPAVNSSPSYWQNYISAGLPLASIPAFRERGASVETAPKNPSADAVTVYKADGSVKAPGYAVVDAGDGNYTVTFGAKIKTNTNVAYDPALPHRVAVGVRAVTVPGNYRNQATGGLSSSTTGVTPTAVTPGAYGGPINPSTNALFGAFTNTNQGVDVYDFMPAASGPGTKLATSARDNVTIGACDNCHYKIEMFPGGNQTSGHFGSRPDTKMCVMCHTPQNADGFPGQGDFTTFIHKIHMGEELPVKETLIGVDFSEVKYPQDLRNCTTCHQGTVTDSWASPSRKACGSCHNNVNFETGANHGLGGIRKDDSGCTLCHDKAYIKLWHTPVAEATSATSGVTSRYAHNANLPAGAYKIEWAITGVTVDDARNVSVNFQIKKDGSAVNFGTYNATTNRNIIPNTVGGPSLRIAYNVTQDGITSPADLNAYMSIPGLGVGAPTVTTTKTPPGVFTAPSTASSLWVNKTLTASGITWTLSGPDATNTYTIKSSLVLPPSTTMVSALMYGSMTQTNLSGEKGQYAFAASSIADFTSYVSTSGSTLGQTVYALKKPGLVLTPPNKLTPATGKNIVARRTIVSNAKCNACHEQLGLFTKSTFHGGGRNDGTVCHVCHSANAASEGWTYNVPTMIHAMHGAGKRETKYKAFGLDWSGITYPGILKNCEQCHNTGTYDFSAPTSASAVDKLLYSTVATGTMTAPYTALAGPPYGTGFSYSASTGAVVTTEAAGTTLVNSPISGACFACHDTATSRSHMEIMGGSLYAPRTAALAKKETCLVCHGAASSTNGVSNDDTPALRAVHRWW